ncbi:NUDIX hydrolase domain-like protein [Biscogniauxia mediterranea]|nr:NUDIX hydrolase domain-like protein [Biscogniauxia mediterranea]
MTSSPPPAPTPATTTYLDLVKACDNFPYIDLSKTPYAEHPDPVYYQLLLPNDPRPHGYMLPSVVSRMPWTSSFAVSPPASRPRTVQVLGPDTPEAINAAFAELIGLAASARVFASLAPPLHDETFRILGARTSTTVAAADSPRPPVQLLRAAAGLFGIACRGSHMTVYTRAPGPSGSAASELQIWVPRRSAHLRTWPGRLDTSVAGGVRASESPFECVVHEADEEASLPASLVRRDARACGAVTYVCASGAGSGGEHGLVVPDVLYVYDLEVAPGVVVPRPRDGEVHEFRLCTVPQVRDALLRGEFKTNSAAVMVDFFVRHGLVTAEDEPDFLDILARLHRPLPVPTTATAAAAAAAASS